MTSANGPYSFRRAFDANAFLQFPLIDDGTLLKEAKKRGIGVSPFDKELLEKLDREAAFSPILFERWNSEGEVNPVFRDEMDFVPWEQYAVSDGYATVPHPKYSPWQLLYFDKAVELQRASMPVEWLLDDERADLHEFWRTQLEHQLQSWRALDSSWRELLLVLIRLQGTYGPAIKGTLTKSTVSLLRDPSSGEYVDPRSLEPAFEPAAVLAELGLDLDRLKEMHQALAMRIADDPLDRWHTLVRMAPYRQRDELKGVARRAQDAYDAAEILHLFYEDLTGELLLRPDEIFDISDKSWKTREFGRWPIRRFTREDLAVELRLRQLHPHQVHLAVEGPTEETVCRTVLETIGGMTLGEMGITIHSFHGVDAAQLQHEMLVTLKAFPHWLILVADQEGTMGKEVERLYKQGVLTDETTFLWGTSFEETNFSDEELIVAIAAAGADAGATLQLDASTLRAEYDKHCATCAAEGRPAQGLATFALRLARHPEYGSVRVSKSRELGEKLAEILLEDIRERGGEAVEAQRPVVAMLASIFRGYLRQMANRATASEEWFDRYLTDHGYDPGDPEPDLGVKTNPDRLITRAGKQAVCEIKQFEQDVVTTIAGQARMLSSSQWLNPVRRAVKKAATQLKPLEDRGLPLVVVLANPKGVHVSLETTDVIHALYGDPTWSIEIDPATGAGVAPANFFAGLNGRLRSHHEYVSAVVILRHRENVQDYADELAKEIRGDRKPKTYEEANAIAREYLEEMKRREDAGDVPDGDYFFVDVIKTASAEATTLHDDFFDAPRDSLWSFDEAAGGYIKAR